MDLGIIFGSFGTDAYSVLKTEKGIAKKLVQNYDISMSGVLVGAVLYGNDAGISWRFGDAANLTSTLGKIDQLRRQSDGSNILKALEVAESDLLSENMGARRNIPKALIIFANSAGGKQKEVELLSQKLKDKGINMIVIYIGSDDPSNSLSGIASDPSKLIPLQALVKDEDKALPILVSKSLPGMFFLSGSVF